MSSRGVAWVSDQFRRLARGRDEQQVALNDGLCDLEEPAAGGLRLGTEKLGSLLVDACRAITIPLARSIITAARQAAPVLALFATNEHTTSWRVAALGREGHAVFGAG